jgi:hypothetical protein
MMDSPGGKDPLPSGQQPYGFFKITLDRLLVFQRDAPELP